jgi:signal peptidase
MRVLRLIQALATVAALAIGAAVLVPGLAGYQRYVVAGGSMTGTYDRGSLLYDKATPVSELRRGDIITYRKPQGGDIVTHRIFAIRHDRQGHPVFTTKGDANKTHDAWTFTPRTRELPRVAAGVPLLGFVYAALSLPILRLLVIVLPALLVAFALVAALWRDAGAAARAGDGTAS